MVRGDGMDDVLALVVLFGDIGANEGMGPFDFMVDGLADIMQQTGALGLFDIHAQFRGHHAAQGRDLQGVLQHVLGEGRTVTQLAQQADDLGMDAVHPGIKRGLFAHLAHLGIQFLLAFLDDVLDAGGMDAAILDQALQGHLGHLTAQRTVRGQDDGLRCIVDDEVHTGGGFESADVAPLTSDDASFHIFAGQGHRRDGLLIDVVPGIALDDVAQDLLGLAVGGLLGLRLYLADHLGRFMAGLGFHFGEQTGLGFFRRQAGDLGKALFFLIDACLQKLFRLGQLAFLAGQILFCGKQLMLLGRGLFQLFFQPAAHLFQLALTQFDFAFAFLEFVLQLTFLVEKVILPLDEDFLLLRLGLLARFFHDALGQLVSVADTLGGHTFVHQRTDQQTGHRGQGQPYNIHKVHNHPL